MLMPRPVPSILLTAALRTRSKGMKIFSRKAGLMPMPLSRQEKASSTGPSPAVRWAVRPTWMAPPSWVYFTALPMMFTRICRRRSSSPSRTSSSIRPISIWSSWFF